MEVITANILSRIYLVIARIRLWYMMHMDAETLDNYLDSRGYAYETTKLIEYLSHYNLTQKKMLAIVYYAYGLYMVCEGRKLADYSFALTDDGPYEETMYYFLGDDDSKYVPLYGDECMLDLNRVPQFFKFVWGVCRDQTADQIMSKMKIYTILQSIERDTTIPNRAILRSFFMMTYPR